MATSNFSLFQAPFFAFFYSAYFVVMTPLSTCQSSSQLPFDWWRIWSAKFKFTVFISRDMTFEPRDYSLCHLRRNLFLRWLKLHLGDLQETFMRFRIIHAMDRWCKAPVYKDMTSIPVWSIIYCHRLVSLPDICTGKSIIEIASWQYSIDCCNSDVRYVGRCTGLGS